MFATVEQIEEAASKQAFRLRYGYESKDYPKTKEGIAAYLERIKAGYLAHDLSKYERPWYIIDVTKRLDPEQAWIGIEYETGYADEKDYQKVVNFVWDGTVNSVIDSEGCGEFPCEITFSPVNMETFLSDEGDMDKLLRFTSENRIPQDREEWDDCVGIHCNISTPAFRNAHSGRQDDVVNVLNASLGSLSDNAKDRLFNRNPYGGFFLQRANGKVWIEGKLFDTTNRGPTWAKYKKIIARLAWLIETLSSMEELQARREERREDPLWGGWDVDTEYCYVTNFRSILLDETDDIGLDYSEEAGSDYYD